MSIEPAEQAPSNAPVAVVGAADLSFRYFLEFILKYIGLAVVADSDLPALMARLQATRPDLVLLETRLPGGDIQEFCSSLRLQTRTRGTAILLLAALGDDPEQDILNCGADEYLSRPFTAERLVAVVHGLLRERGQGSSSRAPELTFVDLELDLLSYRVRRNGHIIHLAPTEFRLLHHLMKNPRKVHSRHELQHAAWPPYVHLGPRTVDVHIGRLRAALKRPGGQDLIRTVRSVGYALSE
jgi:two-component system phosphate regulon response regulator PhoB